MSKKKQIAIFWFRRDLRLDDNAGLYHALRSNFEVLPLFIYDTDILEQLEDKDDARLTMIYRYLKKIKEELESKKIGSSLCIKIGKPIEIYKELTKEYEIKEVYTNHDYEPYAKIRDENIKEFLGGKDIAFKTFKDQVIFEKDEVLKDDGEPYVVYTPYSKKWKSKLKPFYLKPYPTGKYFDNFYKTTHFDFPTYEQIGFEANRSPHIPSDEIPEDIIKNYEETRDFPAKEGTSRLSPHLRFGTISIRKLAKVAKETNEKYFNELIWREFYMSILYHYPKVVDTAFREKYDRIPWRNNEEEFEKWCEGKTGYPLVDAGMRQLNETGFMHNRVRMVVASFLTKHLLIDWRWGEAYFARKLLDYELSSNNGGWQWAAGSGVDAAPYFRIFNPESQLKKFDKNQKYIRTWIEEIDTKNYPKPIVEHKVARERALKTYKGALNG
ncbi:cryptochrome/photolyase family protein [Bernardetia sp.]|uniref:cryptochrome/photolyase family protein n=1 Tax=Bernardetia sp. TaxID=1937974 RepID=UPI0025BAB715|nr:deoxyribodipyrimidine photo-lyase [Bernardetia sp.]